MVRHSGDAERQRLGHIWAHVPNIFEYGYSIIYFKYTSNDIGKYLSLGIRVGGAVPFCWATLQRQHAQEICAVGRFLLQFKRRAAVMFGSLMFEC